MTTQIELAMAYANPSLNFTAHEIEAVMWYYCFISDRRYHPDNYKKCINMEAYLSGLVHERIGIHLEFKIGMPVIRLSDFNDGFYPETMARLMQCVPPDILVRSYHIPAIKVAGHLFGRLYNGIPPTTQFLKRVADLYSQHIKSINFVFAQAFQNGLFDIANAQQYAPRLFYFLDLKSTVRFNYFLYHYLKKHKRFRRKNCWLVTMLLMHDIETNPGPSRKASLKSENYRRHQSAIKMMSHKDLPTIKKQYEESRKKLSLQKREWRPQGLFSGVSGLMPNLTLDISPEVRDCIDKLTRSLEVSSEKLSKPELNVTFPVIEEMMGKITSVFNLHGGVIFLIVDVALLTLVPTSPVVECIFLAMHAYAIYHYQEDILLCSAIAAVYACFQASQWVTSDGVWKPQVGIDYGRKIIDAAMLYMYANAAHTSMEKGGKVVETFAKESSAIKKGYEGLTFTFDYFIGIINEFIRWICSKLDMEDCSLVSDSPFPQLNELQVEIPKTLRKFRDGDSQFNWEAAQEVFALDTKCDKVIATIPMNKEFVAHKQAAIYLKASLRPIVCRLQNANCINNGPRKAPWGFMVGGGTQVGKTTSQHPFVVDIMTRVLNDELIEKFKRNQSDFICYMNKTDEYMSNYHGQYAYLIDEFLQNVDVAGVSNAELMMVFDAINNKNFNISGAALEEKGAKNFNSLIVGGTTNREHFLNLKSIISSEALARRFNFQLWQTVKKEFATEETKDLSIDKRRLDVTKALAAKRRHPKDKLSLDVYEFYMYDFVAKDFGSRVKAGPFTYDEIVEKAALDFLAYQKGQDSLLHFVQHHYESALMERNSFRAKFHEWVPQAGILKTITPWIDLKRKLHMRFKLFREGLNFSEFWSWTQSFPTYVEWYESEDQFSFDNGFNRMLTFYKESIIIPATQETFNMCDMVKKVVSSKAFWITASTFIGMAGAFWCMMKNQFGVQSAYDMKTKMAPKYANRSIRTFGKRSNPQSGMLNQNHQQVIEKAYRRNIYGWNIPGYTLSTSGYFIFLKGRLAVSPHHFWRAILTIAEKCAEKGEECIINFWNVSTPDTIIPINYKYLDAVVAENCYNVDSFDVVGDRVYWLFPELVMQHPDITKFIPDSNNPIFKQKFHGSLMSFGTNHYYLMSSMCVPKQSFKYADIVCNYGYEYTITTADGDCGKMLWMTDSKVNTPYLIGFHTAGNGSSGFATILDKNEIEDAVAYFYPNVVCHEEVTPEIDDPIATLEEAFEAEPHKPEDGVLPGNLIKESVQIPSLTMPSRSKIRHSELYEAWGPAKCKPAHLVPFKDPQGNIVDPLANARKKLCPKRTPINMDLLKSVTSIVKKKIFDKSITDEANPARVLTFEEAVAGIAGSYNGIPRKTSAGFPWSFFVDKGGKVDFFGEDGDYAFDSDKCKALREIVMSKIKLMEEGKRAKFYFMTYLKDERRPKQKVDEGKTRLFNAASLDFLIIYRMYYGHFFAWMETNKIRNGSAVGINPYSDDWHLAGTELLSVSSFEIAMDASNFDGSIHTAVQYAGATIAEEYYCDATEPEKMVRKVLTEDVVNSRHVGVFYVNITEKEGRITFDTEYRAYSYQGTQPSGVPGTAHLNTIYNNICIHYGIACCFVNHDTYSLSEVKSLEALFRVFALIFGDDSIIAIPDDLPVTQIQLQEKLRLIGLECTPEDKSDKVHLKRNLKLCTFLKRFWVDHELSDKLQSALDLDVILEMPYWTKKGNPRSTVIDTAELACKELSAWPRKTFNEWFPKIKAGVLKAYGYTLRFSTYEEYFVAYKSVESVY